MIDIICSVLLIAGCVFVFLASLGMLRMPDIFTRMSASTKASGFGITLIFFSLIIYFEDFYLTVQLLVTIILIYLLSPVSAHLIGRAAYFSGSKLWFKTKIEELNIKEENQDKDKN
jgi:multicomponent Na+:H+ antiporter subunit G